MCRSAALACVCIWMACEHARAQDHSVLNEPIRLRHLLSATPSLPDPLRALDCNDLAKVPQIRLQDRDAAFAHVTDLVVNINRLNLRAADNFIEELKRRRPDLAGLPFRTGRDGRLGSDERQRFGKAVQKVHESLRAGASRLDFWAGLLPPDNPQAVTALTQVLWTDSAYRPGLIEKLADCDNEEATRALARLAIFADEEWQRSAARAALQRRDTRPATGILMDGLRYPWPAVAHYAATTIVQLKRVDLLPDLERMVSAPDPRSPERQMVNGVEVPVVRELVRINHLRNCLLCHPPLGNPNLEARDALTRDLPDPGSPLPLYLEPARTGNAVRADIIYLRQDFSLLQRVTDAAPWPVMQRFDFLVRRRIVTEEQATALDFALARCAEDSPYRRAALLAVQGLCRGNQGITAWLLVGGLVLMLTTWLLLGSRRRPARRSDADVRLSVPTLSSKEGLS
ncbi:MAG: hypothetical protein FJ271_18660 [Planctomycetes bacterium]|nr:hypothetical protein [Planctomycetota bacterium]